MVKLGEAAFSLQPHFQRNASIIADDKAAKYEERSYGMHREKL
jgi:hypothetical protein